MLLPIRASPQVSAGVVNILCKHCLVIAAVTGAVSALDNLLEELGSWDKEAREDGGMEDTDNKEDLEDQLVLEIQGPQEPPQFHSVHLLLLALLCQAPRPSLGSHLSLEDPGAQDVHVFD